MLYKKLISCSYPNVINKELQKKYVCELLLLILSDACRRNREMTEPQYSKETYIEKACSYISRNYNKEITVDALAEYVSLNKNYLIRLFKKELMSTPNQYIIETRLYHARVMLLQTNLSVKSIAFSCGFNTPSYFIKCFKESFGQTPAEYRETHLV